MEQKKNRGVKLAFAESHILFVYRKNVSNTVRQLYNYIFIFGTIVTLLTLDSVVSWSLVMS